jgi:hypothetical protein
VCAQHTARMISATMQIHLLPRDPILQLACPVLPVDLLIHIHEINPDHKV